MSLSQAEAQSCLEEFLRLSKDERASVASMISLHEHPLEPRWTSSGLRVCDACGDFIPVGSRLRCKSCDFDLHHHCSHSMTMTLMIVWAARAAVPRSPLGVYLPELPTKSSKYAKLVQRDQEKLVNIHFIHDHTMDLYSIQNDYQCGGCRQRSRGGLWYLCRTCGFGIHKQCSAIAAHGYGLYLYATRDRGSENFVRRLCMELIKHSLLHLGIEILLPILLV